MVRTVQKDNEMVAGQVTVKAAGKAAGIGVGARLMEILALFAFVTMVLPAAQALAQSKRSTAIIPGGNAKAPININAGRLDFLDKESKLIYSGGVVARQGDSTLKCSKLTIFMAKDAMKNAQGSASSGDQVRKMEADGPVTITSKDQVGTGNHGVFDKVNNVVYLIGNPVLTQGANITRGGPKARLVYNLTTGRARITGGRVQSIIVPQSSDKRSGRNGR